MKIYLLRHAESTSNPNEKTIINGRDLEAPLSDVGKAQAERLAAKIDISIDSPIQAIYVSPALRTRQTLALLEPALVIAEAPKIVDEQLIELTQGVAEGKRREDVYTPDVVLQRETLGKDFSFEEGESMNDAAARLRAWLTNIAGHYEQDAVILAVSHAMLIRSYVSVLENWTLQQTLDNLLGNCHVVELELAADGSVRLVRFDADLAS